MQKGYGKRVPLADYPVKGRATGGVSTASQRNMDLTGKVAVARVVQEEDDITVISSTGAVLRLKAKDISVLGRSARGFRVMNISEGNSLVSLARIAAADLQGINERAPNGNKPGTAGPKSNGPESAIPESPDSESFDPESPDPESFEPESTGPESSDPEPTE
jgi:DNA gyrase subunit A